MAVALKDELHRLIDEIPDTHPEVARVLFELTFLLLVSASNDELQFRRIVRDVAEAQAASEDPNELLARLQSLRDGWVHGRGGVADSLLAVLESAPDDDEPLTAEDVALLDARRAAVAVGPTITHDELGRQLQP